MAKILITGFTPFDGREHNASWKAAYWLAENHQSQHDIRAALIPVIWGAPGEVIRTWVTDWQPDFIISMGEGHSGRFAIEMRARNQRKLRQDNNRQLPCSEQIALDGPIQYSASIKAGQLMTQLHGLGYPMQLSQDAGQFLCEELLYSLESARISAGASNLQVLFCHLPPYGSELEVNNRKISCDQDMLARFASDLLSALQDIYQL